VIRIDDGVAVQGNLSLHAQSMREGGPGVNTASHGTMTRIVADQYETVSDKNPATEAFVFPVEDKSKEQDPQGNVRSMRLTTMTEPYAEEMIPEKLRRVLVVSPLKKGDL